MEVEQGVREACFRGAGRGVPGRTASHYRKQGMEQGLLESSAKGMCTGPSCLRPRAGTGLMGVLFQ